MGSVFQMMLHQRCHHLSAEWTELMAEAGPTQRMPKNMHLYTNSHAAGELSRPYFAPSTLTFEEKWQFPDICSSCRGLVQAPKLMCSKCKSINYCQRSCQVKNHPSHRKSCKAIDMANTQYQKFKDDNDQEGLALILTLRMWAKFDVACDGHSALALNEALADADELVAKADILAHQSKAKGLDLLVKKAIRERFSIVAEGPDKYLDMKLRDFAELTGLSWIDYDEPNFSTVAKPLIVHLSGNNLTHWAASSINFLLAYALRLRCIFEEGKKDLEKDIEEQRARETKRWGKFEKTFKNEKMETNLIEVVEDEKNEAFKAKHDKYERRLKQAVKDLEDCTFLVSLSPTGDILPLLEDHNRRRQGSSSEHMVIPFFEMLGIRDEVKRTSVNFMARTGNNLPTMKKVWAEELRKCKRCEGKCLKELSMQS